MPIIQRLVNFDRMVAQLKEPPVIVNDLINATDEEKVKIREMITTRYQSDMLSILPTCQCGKTKGEFAIGTDCGYCHTKVRSVVNEDIEPIVWFRAPEGVTKLINPIIWVMIKNRFRRSGFSIVQWICDTTYRPTVKQPKVITDLIALGIQRGYNYFVENFDMVMNTLFSMKDFRSKRGQIDYLQKLLETHRDCIFSGYLPLPNKSLLVIEKTNVGIYVDPTIIGAIDAIEMIVNIDSPLSEHTVRVKENRTVKALVKLAEFYENFFKTNLSGKGGIYRKHVFGSRIHFGFRAVITSLTDAHQYDEIHVPWGIATTALRPHVMNRLLRYGYNHNDAIGMINGHVEKYHPLIAQIFKDLINESKHKGISCILQRNPSLLQGSAQLVRMTKVKDDPADHTVAMSILICVAFNADFDGKYHCRR